MTELSRKQKRERERQKEETETEMGGGKTGNWSIIRFGFDPLAKHCSSTELFLIYKDAYLKMLNDRDKFHRFSRRHGSKLSLPPSWSLPRRFRSTQSAPCCQRWRISFLLAGPATDGPSRLHRGPWWWHTPWLWCWHPGRFPWTAWNDTGWLHEGED